jgi:hypothetical protein
VPKCPISCGECCDQWAHIEVLWHNNRHLDLDDPCPKLGPHGCRLPRKHRPRACREYLCSRAKEVLQLMAKENQQDPRTHEQA